MIFLSGGHPNMAVSLNDQRIGVMLTPAMNNRPNLSGTLFACDTGCFAKPEAYTTERYVAWLASLIEYRRTCLFATAPDVFGNGHETLKVALPVLPIIRALGYPAALVIQPGITVAHIPWESIDAVFVGGPDWWQRSQHVADVVAAAAERGVWRHKGRVNSEQRLRAAMADQYDSADGTWLKYGPDVNLPKILRAVERVSMQTVLDWRLGAA